MLIVLAQRWLVGLFKGTSSSQILLRAEKTIDLQHILRGWIADVNLPAQVRLHIDIDPYSFL